MPLVMSQANLILQIKKWPSCFLKGSGSIKQDHRDLPDTVGLIPLIVHKSHCHPATSKDTNTWRRQQNENQSSPKSLTGYLLDPDLFQLIARGSRLQLPNIPFHAAHWRQPACLRFQLQLSSVMRVGQLQSLAAWRSLINPSPSRLPLCWGLWIAHAARSPYV